MICESLYIDGQKYLESSEDRVKDVVHRLYTALHMDEYQVRLHIYMGVSISEVDYWTEIWTGLLEFLFGKVSCNFRK